MAQVSILASRLSCLVRFTAVPIFFQMKEILHVAEVNKPQCLEDSGQWLENVDRTHPVLASGMLLLQKNYNFDFILAERL